MTLRNFDEPFRHLNGKPITAQELGYGDSEEPIMLKDIITQVLETHDMMKEPNLTNQTKRKRAQLGEKIHQGGNINIDAEETVLLTELVEKNASILLAHRIMDALERDLPASATRNAPPKKSKK